MSVLFYSKTQLYFRTVSKQYSVLILNAVDAFAEPAVNWNSVTFAMHAGFGTAAACQARTAVVSNYSVVTFMSTRQSVSTTCARQLLSAVQ